LAEGEEISDMRRVSRGWRGGEAKKELLTSKHLLLLLAQPQTKEQRLRQSDKESKLRMNS
jgi:hypothetical protein